MLRKVLFLVLIPCLTILLSCGEKKSDTPQNESSNKSDLENFADKMKEVSENFSEGKKVTPVDFRDLKSLLPETASGLKRTNIEGEKTSAMGINVSTANADYGDQDKNQSMDIKITDLGSVSGLSALAAYGWYMVDVDKENDNGYEKTITYKGYKAYEKYDNNGKYGELNVLVAKRFVVEVNGNNVTMDQMKSALGTIDLSKLESMKDFGVEK